MPRRHLRAGRRPRAVKALSLVCFCVGFALTACRGSRPGTRRRLPDVGESTAGRRPGVGLPVRAHSDGSAKSDPRSLGDLRPWARHPADLRGPGRPSLRSTSRPGTVAPVSLSSEAGYGWRLEHGPARGIGRALFAALDQFAALSGHRELASARLILLGFSGTGSLVGRFAGYAPDRVMAVVATHPGHNPLGLETIDLTPEAAAIPQFILAKQWLSFVTQPDHPVMSLP